MCISCCLDTCSDGKLLGMKMYIFKNIWLIRCENEVACALEFFKNFQRWLALGACLNLLL
jgi:hypothetical protein